LNKKIKLVIDLHGKKHLKQVPISARLLASYILCC